MAIITAIFGALFGLYINNFLTWKIKNKIDSLDIIKKDMLCYNDLYLSLCNKAYYQGKWNNEDSETFNQLMLSYKNNIIINCSIIDECKAGTLFNVIYPYFNTISSDIKQENIPNMILCCLRPDDKISIEMENYEKLLFDLLDYIDTYRRKLTSFEYIVKQLIYNKGAIIIGLLLLLFVLIYYFCKCSSSI